MSQSDTSALDNLHHEWEEVHTRLRELEQRLSDAIALYARGRGPRPIELMSEVEALRAQCARRFEALMTGIRRHSAG
jgi:hypothetical protein